MVKHKHKTTYRIYSKEELLSFYILFVVSVFFLLFFLVYLFTQNFAIGIFSFVLILVDFALLFWYIKLKDANPLRELISAHNRRKDLISDKNFVIKEFLKRKITQKELEEEIDKIEGELLEVDFKIHSFDVKNANTKSDLESKSKLLYKKYLKKEISEKFYKKLNLDLKKQMQATKN